MKRTVYIVACLVSAVLVFGCASDGDQPSQGLPSQTLLPDNVPTAQVSPSQPVRPPAETLIVIEPGAEEDPNRGIVEASKAERKRRQEAGTPSIVLTDRNLQEFQEGAQLTFLHEEEGATVGSDFESHSAGELDPTEIGEGYWRDRGRQIRTGWRQSVDRIEELQGDVVEYRRRFYEEDDPSVRDTLIKPAWDRALEELDEERIASRQFEEDLQKYLDLGYESGAYGEWLDEGVELEPTSEELDLLARYRNTIQFDEPDIAADGLDPEDIE